LDAVLISIVALGTARGLWLGLVREAFSLAALAAAAFVVWSFGDGAAEALAPRLGDALPPAAIRALASLGLGLGALLLVGLVGRVVRRSIRFVGLGLVDRAAGGCLGALEGGLLAALLLAGATALLDPGHPWLARSQAVALLERTREAAAFDDASARDVAAPAPRPPE
jgi:membrane protein required for colicin V production